MVRSRRKAAAVGEDLGDDAEFPDLPGLVNDVLYSLGTVLRDLRRRWKMGTSLLMVATVHS